MVKEHKLHLLELDDGSVVCLGHGQAIMLPATVAAQMHELLEMLQPEEIRPSITPPDRSAELAERANGPVRKYAMTGMLLRVLSSMAQVHGTLTTSDVMALCDIGRNTLSSKLSMLTTNGYLTRVGIGKYLVSPEGRNFLLGHAD